MTQKILRVILTQGAIDNGYISVPLSESIFPPESYGDRSGTKKGKSVTITDALGKSYLDDIRGVGNSARPRARFGSFFKAVKAKQGDVAELEMVSPGSYQLRIVHGNSATPVVPTPSTKPIQEQTHKTDAISMFPKNTILYGPPGTGKTYSVVLKSMSIIDGKDYGLNVSADVYTQLKLRYDALTAGGQISFVTFHQSYGYEDFVEGIRPTTVGQQISYEVRDGILKSIAGKARENWLSAKLEQQDNLSDEFLFDKIWQELFVRLDESPEGKLKITLLRGGESEVLPGPKGRSVIVSSPSNKNDYSLPKKQFKELWERRGEITRPADMKLYNASYFLAVLGLLKGIEAEIGPVEVQLADEKPFVLVIDEINRGNISKIFGELITLVEEDKRLGEPFEMKVTLPYSQEEEEPFGLPPNLYLVGTMNTSDRSIALLDTALRRRFEFEELQPNPDVLSRNELDVDIDLVAMLYAINERVEYLYDRDHMIGHAYFIGVKTLNDLDRVFRRKVIPLLQEYFYEDWSKVILVLNDQAGAFIDKTEKIPAGLQGADMGLDAKARYKVRPGAFGLDAFMKIYN